MDNRKIDESLKALKPKPEELKAFNEKGEEIDTKQALQDTKPKPPTPKPVEPEPEEDFVRKTKEDYGIDESFDDYDFEEEEKPKIIIKQKDEEKEWLIKALENNQDPNLQAYLKYQALGQKQKEGKELTQEETLFLSDMNKLYEMEAQQQALQEKKIKENKETKEKIRKEYEKTKKNEPHKIDKVHKNLKLTGAESLPRLLKFALLMKKAKNKGGKLVVKVTRDRKVMIEWTNKPLSFVEFWTTDEKGEEIPEITRFNEFKYNYEGTPIPVLFAIQGYAEGFDFFDEFRKDITSEMVSRIASRARHSGFLEGINQREKESKKGMFASLEPFMPLIILGGFVIMIVMMYMLYGEITKMVEEVETMKNAIGVMVLQ